MATFNDCNLIRGILLSFTTPHGKSNARLIFALNPQLRDCQSYAHRIAHVTS